MNKDPEVKKVIILGSGFSRALHSLMPLTNHLTKAVDEGMKNHDNKDVQSLWKKHVTDKNIGNINSKEGNFEEILSYLDDCHAWKDEFVKLEHQILYKATIPVIAREIEEKTKDINYENLLAREDGWLKKFIEKIEEENISAITFNYDLIFEWLLIKEVGKEPCGFNSTGSSYGFLNYFTTIYPILSKSISKEVAGLEGHRSIPRKRFINLKILKLHGSINWFYSQSEKTVIVDDLLFSKAYETVKSAADYARDIVRKNYQPLLIPPTQNKTSDYVSIEPIKQQWVEAARLLSEADKVYIIGYSSPATDISTNLMLQSAIKKDCRVIICNKDDSAGSEAKRRYKEEIFAKMKSDVEFYDNGFDKKFVKEIFLR